MFKTQRPAIVQSGNVLLALYAAIGMIGVLGAVGVSVLKGPVRGMHNVTQNTVVQNDMIAATALLSEYSLKDLSADCDADGMIEPVPFKTGGAGVPVPAGGGVIPDMIGAKKTDPWKSLYGYCVWDHGNLAKVAGCGGAAANRLAGGDIATATTIAVISAGPDRTFQTTCANYAAAGTPVVNKPEGSDDIVKEVPYGSFLLPRMANATIGSLPDEACTPQTIGMMRVELGVVQVCMDTGWEEVGTSAQADGNFVHVENAALGQTYTSNAISFSGFLNTKTINVEGAASVLINGIVTPMPAQIVAGDSVQLRAAASPIPEETLTFSVSISGVKKTWSITTRDRTPANLLISPSPVPGFIINGESGTAYSSTVEFMLTNIGEERAVVSVPSLSNTTNFEIVSNDCASATLGKNQSCEVHVRSKATATGVHAGNLNFYAAGEHYGGSHTPSASLSSDALFPVTLANATNVNLSAIAEFTASGRWASGRPKRVIVPAGVIIGSTSAGIPAMRTGTGRGGTLTITVNGEIQGAGGVPNGGTGGTALLAEQSGVTLINNGAIRSGGGAGGRGGTGGTGGSGYYYDYQRYDFPYSRYGGNWEHYQGGNRLYIGEIGNPFFGDQSRTYYDPGNGWRYYRGSVAEVYGGTGHYVYKQRITPLTVATSGGSGGAGGNGGRGQGYDGSASGGHQGNPGLGGGENAGVGGRGGTGGAGGGWGANGAAGQTGHTGVTASGAGSIGTGGSSGGASGYAIQNSGYVARTGGGALQGRL